ncbi:hypothetical protein [uncultured Thiodictyon sp.]|uniref:hypothetical protein n=1 Tax=uncultured Thiodictyon sp. TaxID=1846217 RepID=UPI0025FA4622|nr:hypothetical protein [uncultured Thiodictyon sp.]
MRWLVLFLLIANIGLFIWGWTRESPRDPPLPPLATAPGQIRLLGEPAEPGGGPVAKP